MPMYHGEVFLNLMRTCIASIDNETVSSSGRGVVLRIGAHLAWADANDPFGDVLRRSRSLSTLLVEPHPSTFAKLSALLREERARGVNNVVAINAAACTTDRNLTFFTAVGDTSSGAGAQFSSASREHVATHLRMTRTPTSSIRELYVPCFSVPTLLAQQSADERSLLMLTVDAEGSDLDILQGVVWGHDHALPRLVMFEQTHVNRQPGGREKLQGFVSALSTRHRYACQSKPARTHGLEAKTGSPDMWCVHHRASLLPGCNSMWPTPGAGAQSAVVL